MSDIFGTNPNKATQAVIDAASKIMMGVKDDETEAAQTEEEHPIVKDMKEHHKTKRCLDKQSTHQKPSED